MDMKEHGSKLSTLKFIMEIDGVAPKTTMFLYKQVVPSTFMIVSRRV